MPKATILRGPALLYVGTDGTVTQVDTAAVADSRERHLYRALTAAADQLADEADEAEQQPKRSRIGFQLTSDTELSED